VGALSSRVPGFIIPCPEFDSRIFAPLHFVSDSSFFRGGIPRSGSALARSLSTAVTWLVLGGGFALVLAASAAFLAEGVAGVPVTTAAPLPGSSGVEAIPVSVAIRPTHPVVSYPGLMAHPFDCVAAATAVLEGWSSSQMLRRGPSRLVVTPCLKRGGESRVIAGLSAS